MEFTKMHGIGNDYVYIDARNQSANWSEVAKTVSDRHFGIGGDGLILIHDSDKADLRMQMFNSDGSEGEMCGNGIRCFVKLAVEKNMLHSKPESVSVETPAGILNVVPQYNGDSVSGCTVNMGLPILIPSQVPVSLDSEWNNCDMILDYPFNDFGQNLKMAFVSMGNPHAICFIEEPVDEFPLTEIGPKIENHDYFPEKCNVTFAKVINSNHIKVKVWERGAGLTRACGTAACATAVASSILNLTERNTNIEFSEGLLNIEWNQNNNIYMKGKVSEIKNIFVNI